MEEKDEESLEGVEQREEIFKYEPVLVDNQEAKYPGQSKERQEKHRCFYCQSEGLLHASKSV